MNARYIMLALSCAVIAVALLIGRWLPERDQDMPPKQAVNQAEALKADTAQKRPDGPATKPTSKVVAASNDDPKSASLSEIMSQPVSVEIAEGVSQQMKDIANAYADNMRFPKYSKPLNKSDWNLLNPRAFISKPVPMGFNESVSAEIILEQYIVHRDQDLPVVVRIESKATDEFGDSIGARSVSLSIVVEGRQKPLIQLDSDSGGSTFSGIVPAGSFQGLAPGEAVLAADMRFSSNQTGRVAAVIKLVANDATLVALGDPHIEGAHLIIPADFEVNQSGYYRFQANLFDATGTEPISHLNSAFMLSPEQSQGKLKVHAATLRAKNAPGPYLLKGINITRGPAHPGDKTGYGRALQENYPIKGFALNRYSDEAYEDPDARQRLEFLHKLAGGPDT